MSEIERDYTPSENDGSHGSEPVTVQSGPDFELRDEGTIWLLLPLCHGDCPDDEDPAKTCQCPPAQWIEEHLPEDAQRWSGNGVVIEHRYVDNWTERARACGFSIQTYLPGGAKHCLLEAK